MPLPDTYVQAAPIRIEVTAPQGPPGDSAYQTYVNTTTDDPVLTEEQWSASLVGAQGPSGTLEVGTVTTGAPGSSVVITNTGTPEAAVLDITIPRGDTGETGPNSVTSSTTSDGTGNLSFASVTTPTLKAAGAAGLDIKNADGTSLLRAGVDHTGTGGQKTGLAIGENTDARGAYSFASGANTTASGEYSHTSGENCIASGNHSVASGESCTASGTYSHAGSRRAKAIHDGTFVHTDSQDADCESTSADQATFRFLNGYRFLGGAAAFSQVEATQEGIGTATLHPNYLILSNNDGSASAQIYADQIATTSKIFLLPNASGTIALTSDITGTNSGTNTGDETASRIAALIAGTTNKATPEDSDKLGYVTAAGGLVYALWSEIKTWLGTWLDAVATIAGAKTASGAWSFTSTTRPTSAGTGTPGTTDLITREDGDTRFGQVIRSFVTSDAAAIQSQTTLQDTGCSVTLEAGTWHIRAYTATTNVINTAQAKFGGAITGGSFSELYGKIQFGPGNAIVTGDLIANPFTTAKAYAASTTRTFIEYDFVLVVTSGNPVVKTQYAQNVSTATDTIRKAGCYIIATKVS